MSSTPSREDPPPGSASSSGAARSSSAPARRTADGRIGGLAETEPGTYRIVFHPASPFFRRVELEVELGEGHHHIPLLVSSYACATYRGS